MVERFFGGDARARIEAAVREAEASSLGQIVPVVVERSAGYPEARYRGGLLGGALVTLLCLLADHYALWPVTLALLPVLQLAGGIAGALLALAGPVERVLAGRAELGLAARDRALRAFHEHGLHRTALGTGVLVFASLFERRAVVLGDHGIHARMGEAEWQRAVDALSAGMRAGDPARGFCEAIRQVGARLAQHFPRGPGDRPNELPDALRSEER
jgi:putative membrane protein